MLNEWIYGILQVKPFVSLAGAGRMGGTTEENAEEEMASAAGKNSEVQEI
jgi:hypothetical protein